MTQPKIDVQFLNPFIDSTIETLKVQCQTEVKPGKTFLKGTGPVITIDIAAIIGLASDAFQGNIAICFPKAVFLSLMGKMLSDTFSMITPDLEDGASELLNIIFGQAKRILNQKGYKIEKAIPTIIRGNDIKVRQLAQKPVLVLPFDTEFGAIHIEIALEG